jgi:hypothetical protein
MLIRDTFSVVSLTLPSDKTVGSSRDEIQFASTRLATYHFLCPAEPAPAAGSGEAALPSAILHSAGFGLSYFPPETEISDE